MNKNQINNSILNLNLKYDFFYTYDKTNEIVFDEKGIAISKTHIIYKILEKYNKMLKSLTDILIIPNKSIEEADKSLVYKGKDSKGRYQYCYGVNYIDKRIIKKIDNFMKIYKKMDLIQEIINTGLEETEINKTFLFASILLLELTFFIRLGKDIYLDNNDTIGLLTLKKKNITIKNNNILISFKAKSNKNQEFVCYKETQPVLFAILTKLYNNTKQDEDFIFMYGDKHFTERMLNLRLKEIELTLKDFRTYGVNILFLKTIFDNLNHSPKLNIKKLINQGIKDAAVFIGHSKNISKKSYLSNEIVKAVESFLEKYENDIRLDFNEFIKKILDKC